MIYKYKITIDYSLLYNKLLQMCGWKQHIFIISAFLWVKNPGMEKVDALL